MTATAAGRYAPLRPPGGVQERADRTRAAVISETVRCVLDEGFEAPSVRRITARAGVTWGVVKYHFGGLTGLLMAVTDQGFAELLDALENLALPAHLTTLQRTELVVDRVWEAFSSPTSTAALGILIATRAMREEVADVHLAQLMVQFTALGRQLGENLAAPQAGEIGNLIWTAVRGMVVAQMASTRQIDFFDDRRMLAKVIAAYIQSCDADERRPRRSARRGPRARFHGGP